MDRLFTRTMAHWASQKNSFAFSKWDLATGQALAKLVFEDYLAALEGVTLPDDPNSRYRPKIPDIYYDGEDILPI
jgi:hypothetical protein